MDCTLYWRNPLKKLCSMKAFDVSSVEEAKQLALSELHDTNEIFMLPLLCVVQGGKV